MKKLGILTIFLFLIIINITYNYNQNKEILVGEKEAKIEETNSSIAIMLQNEEGEYIKSTDNEWPKDGYTFNETYSSCENGSKLSWNIKTGEITLISNISDKCYVYFDKKKNEPLEIENVEVDNKSTYNTVKLTVKATGGTGKISYSVENTCTRCNDSVDSCGYDSTNGDISINNNIITINNLNSCYTHSFTVKAQDEVGAIVTSQVSDISVSSYALSEPCAPCGVDPSTKN